MKTLLILAALQLPEVWIRPVEPVRVAGNIYYVGTEDLGSWLIAGKDGAILLDAPLEENVDLIVSNIRKLGRKPSDVRILLNSHAHYDHAGGFAKMRQITGAKLYMSAADAELAARGGRDDFAFGDRFAFTPVTADKIIEDGEVVRLGNITMTAMLTPGHTKGCTTWRMTVVELGKPLDVVFLCSVTAPQPFYNLVDNELYPQIFDDYRRTFAKLRGLRPDIFLANHGSFFSLMDKVRKKKPFIDRAEFPAFLEESWSDLEKARAKQLQ